MSGRLLIAGELGSRHGAAAVLVGDPGNRRWLGQADAQGELLLLSDGVVHTVAAAERASLPTTLAGLGIHPGALLASDIGLARALPGYPCLDVSDELAAARMRKGPEEVELVAAAAALASAGHAAARAVAAPGLSELDLWASARGAMTAVSHELAPAEGDDLEVRRDLLAGPRTAEIDGEPGTAVVLAGQPVLVDLAPRLRGYWADSCATFAVGAPPSSLRRRHDAVRAALEAGIAAARPGVTAGELDATVRDHLDAAGLSCPHHSGHGVGVAPQEPPFLVPHEPTRLEQGMTIAIEPGAYGDGFGVRLEHLVVIEADGARPLTTHPLDLI